jgi:ubiquinone/menaquinone biosynthesis C-methylase UbiE
MKSPPLVIMRVACRIPCQDNEIMLAQSSPGGRLEAAERQRRAYRFWAPLYDEIYGGILRPAHRAIVELVSADEGRVLEVGVGTGLLLPQYPAHLQVTGLDISEHMLARAHRKVQDHRLDACRPADG